MGSKICGKGKWIFHLFFNIMHNEMTSTKLAHLQLNPQFLCNQTVLLLGYTGLTCRNIARGCPPLNQCINVCVWVCGENTETSRTATRVLTDGLTLGLSGLAQTTGGSAPLETAGRKKGLDQVTPIVVSETGTISQHSE